MQFTPEVQDDGRLFVALVLEHAHAAAEDVGLSRTRLQQQFRIVYIAIGPHNPARSDVGACHLVLTDAKGVAAECRGEIQLG